MEQLLTPAEERCWSPGKLFFLLCFAAFAAVILRSSQPPLLRDYPDWVYQGALLAKTLTGHPVVGYALKPYPVPNSVTTLGLGLLTLAFGWMWAAKLWLVAYLALAVATVFHVASVLRPSHWVWWAFPAVLFFGQTFWFATISFSIGVCLLLLLACALYQRQERIALIGGLLLLCFFTHLIVYAAAGVLVLLYCVQRQRWRLTWVGLATLPLPVWYFVARNLTHSNESEYGHSPLSHLAVPAVLGAGFLCVAFLRPGRALSRTIAPVLAFAGGLLFALALLSSVVPLPHLGGRPEAAVAMLRLKALTLFQLFGFINIIYEPGARPLFSASLTLLRGPLFFGLMALDMAAGLALMVNVVLALLRPVAEQDAGRFLWDFVGLFSFLYLVCPPNALGVVSIDMRLAQMALGPALFLVARNSSAMLRWASLPLILLLGASLYQFAASQRRVQIPGTETGLPWQLGGFSAVDPTATTDEYDRLRTGKLEGFIWTTGLFAQTIPWQHAQPVGR